MRCNALPLGAPLRGRTWTGARGAETPRDDRLNCGFSIDPQLRAEIVERARSENTSFAEQVRRLVRHGLKAGTDA